jgi:FkbM family methyltransferase
VTFTLAGNPYFSINIYMLDVEFPGYLARHAFSDGEIVFDVGAYQGLFSAFIHKNSGKRLRIFCFEPEEENFRVMTENLRLNGMQDAVAVKKGLLDREGTVKFLRAGSGSQVVDDPGQADSEVEMTTLEEACRKFGIKRPDFVKMDVEGSELKVIGAAKDFLRNNAVDFAVASYHRTPDGGTTSKGLEALFREIGYKVETGFPAHLTTYAWKAA